MIAVVKIVSPTYMQNHVKRPCRRCDVRDVTQPSTPSPAYVTHRHNIVNPSPPRRVTSFMDNP